MISINPTIFYLMVPPQVCHDVTEEVEQETCKPVTRDGECKQVCIEGHGREWHHAGQSLEDATDADNGCVHTYAGKQLSI